MSDIEQIRAWRDLTRQHYDRPSRSFDSDAVANAIGWWKDVDLLLSEVDRLRSDIANLPPDRVPPALPSQRE